MSKYFLSIASIIGLTACSSAAVFTVPAAPAKEISTEVSAGITNYFAGVEKRYIKKKMTKSDELVLHGLYGSMIAYGAVFAPEASVILRHYLYGDGSDVELDASYIKNSPVVKAHIKSVKNRPGTYKKYFKQTADKRLSYAYNPYHLKITRNKDGSTSYKLYQKIVFHNPKKSKGVRTTFWVGNLKFKISDQLVYAAGSCKPFVAYAEWTE